MDVSALRGATDELGAYLSEMTAGDLRRPTTIESRDLGDVYLRAVERNRTAAAGLAAPSGVTRDTLGRAADMYGGGYEVAYRRSAEILEKALTDAPEAEIAAHLGEIAADTRAVRLALELD